MEELFESGQVEDLVADWLGAVDGVLQRNGVREDPPCQKSEAAGGDRGLRPM